jgi:hypothetical protein
MPNPLHKRPWLLVIVAFVALVGAWTALITFARSHADEAIPLPPPAAATKP